MNALKFDLKDVSFLIPVRIDSEERMENLIAVIKYLSSNFYSNIIVLEADDSQKYFPEIIETEILYHFIYDEDAIYHKTFYVNKLLSETNTKYAVVWDADTIAYPGLIVNGIMRLRRQEAFLVFPFDGRVHFVNPLLSTVFRQTMKFDFLEDYLDLMDLTYGYYATGGAYMIDRKKYLNVGGENEKFYGWGPEDTERVKRMEVLGLRVYYESGGGLFHLWHPRKNNSWFANKNTELRNRKELLHTCRADPDSLLKYLDKE